MSKYYAGIGSRETPEDVLEYMELLAIRLGKLGYILRSGGAGGADTAFELGVVDPKLKEIYIPWGGFGNGSPEKRFDGIEKKYHNPEKGNYALQNLGYEEAAMKIAGRLHPAWGACSRGAKSLHSRNIHQVLGQDLQTPVDFIIAYAKTDKHGTPKGGTAMAISLADMRGIPVYNLYIDDDRKKLEAFLDGKNS